MEEHENCIIYKDSEFNNLWVIELKFNAIILNIASAKLSSRILSTRISGVRFQVH
jgi:hypothetical protein